MTGQQAPRQSFRSDSTPSTEPSTRRARRWRWAELSLLATSLLLGACTTCGGPTPETSRAEGTQGTLMGELSVSDRGNAGYRVDADVPPGTNGLEPHLALAYNSAAKNGLLGVGWTLAGLPVITRTGANIEQDGFKGGVGYDADDRFTYSGQRLITIEGEVGGDGSVYRTEKESWQKLVSHTTTDTGGTCGSGPCWWQMTTEQGIVYRFGGTADSRIAAAGGDGSIRAWALDSISDLDGNVLGITYTATPYDGATDQGQYYPFRIDYTSNPGSGLEAQRQVTFTYEQRPDPIQVFIGGSAVVTSARLTGISTKVGDQGAPDIRLSYDTSPATGRSRIRTIQTCSGDGNLCLPPTEIAWTDASLAFTDRGSWLDNDFVTGWSDSDPRLVADVNSDGRLDLVGFRLDTQVAPAQTDLSFGSATSWNSGFGSNEGWRGDLAPRTLADVNGDGVPDVVGFDLTGVKVAISTRRSFDTSLWSQSYPYFGFSTGGWTIANDPRMMADVDGDGRADIVGFKDQTLVGLAQESSFADPAVWNASDFTGSAWWQARQRLRLLGDVNGDGLADVVGFSNDGVIVGPSTGRQGHSFDTSKWPQNSTGYPYFDYDDGWLVGRHPRLLADVNGDGLSDIVGFKDGVQVGLSNGRGFEDPVPWSPSFSVESSPPWTDSQPRTMADVNGDGRADVVGFSLTGAKVGLSTGSAFIESTWNQDSLPDYRGGGSGLLVTGDCNGDGLGDAVAFGSKVGAPVSVSVALAAGGQPDLAQKITNGLGGTLTISYAAMTDPAVYSPDDPGTDRAAASGGEAAGLAYFATANPVVFNDLSTQYPIQSVVGGHVYLVRQVVESTDAALQASQYSYSTLYSYAAARLDVLAQRWLGFAQKTRLFQGDGRETVERYNQTYPLDGTLAQRSIQCGPGATDPRCTEGALMLRSTRTYESPITATGTGPKMPPVYDVLKASQQIDHYTYGTLDTSIRNEYHYDDFGNPNRQVYLGYVSADGKDRSSDDNVTLCKDYLNLESDWKLGYVLHVKRTTSSDCTDLSTFDPATDLTLSTRTYDTASGTLDVLSEGRWDDQADGFLTYQYTYDAFGNRVTLQDPQGNVWTTDFDTTYHTFPSAQSGPPLSAKGDLVITTQLNHDPRFGVEIASVDANGGATLTCVDDLGRVIAVQDQRPDSSTPTDPSCVTSGPGSDAQVVTISTTRWTADGAGGIYSEKQDLQQWPTSGGDASFLYGRSYLDGRARIYEHRSQGSPDTGDLVTCVVYDGYNRKPKISLPFETKTEPNCSADGSAPFWRTRSYDVLGRVVRRTHPGGADGARTVVDETVWSGVEQADQTLAATSSSPYRRTFDYRTFFNTRRMTDVLVTSDGDARTEIGYDRLARITSTTAPATAADPQGITTTYQLDSLGRKVRMTFSDRDPISFDYHGTENLASRTDFYGTQTYAYDEMARLTERSAPGGLTLRYSYDSTRVPNGLGRQTSATVVETGTADLVETFGYDALGNSAHYSLTGVGSDPSHVYQLTRGFDPRKRLVGVTLPDGRMLRRTYAWDNLSMLSLDGGELASYPDYSPLRKPESIDLGGGVVEESIAYSPTGEMITHQVQGGGQTYLDRTLDWSELGEVRSIADGASLGGHDLSQSLDYTSLRLTGAQGIYGSLGYGYDHAGNLTGRDPGSGDAVSYTYEGFKVTAGTAGGQTVFEAHYDGYGAMTGQTAHGSPAVAYSYDALARMRDVEAAGGVVYVHRYTADGRRVETRDAGAGLTTVYADPAYQVVTNDSGDALTTVVASGPLGVAATVTTGSGAVFGPGIPAPGTLFLHLDQVGSTALTTDPAGSWSGLFAYDPYGALVLVDGNDTVRPKFTGQELDEASGLYFYRTRYLDPAIGRFLTPDRGPGASPAVQDALNTYGYVGGRPTSLVDPSGQQIVAAIVAAAAEVAAVATEAAAEATAVGAEVGAAVGEAGAIGEGTAATASTIAASETVASTEATAEAGIITAAHTAARTALVSEESLAATTLGTEEAIGGSSLEETGTLLDSTSFEGESPITQCPSPCRVSSLFRRLVTRISPWSDRPVTLYRGMSNLQEIQELTDNGILRSPQFRIEGEARLPESMWRRFSSRFFHSLDSSNPSSPWVSTTSSRWIARSFAGNGDVYSFVIPRNQIYRAWHSPFFWEFEYLAEDGTSVSNLRNFD